MPSQQPSPSSASASASKAPSTYSESTIYSYSKPSEPQPESEKKPRRSLRPRIKKSLKEVGYPPTYHYDVQSGNKRPEYGIFGDTVFTDKRSTKFN